MSSKRHIPRLAFASGSVELPIKTVQQDQKTMRMDAFVSKSCPSLYQPYNPPHWMHNGHVQTAYCVVGDFTKVDKIVYHRKLLRAVDGGTLGLDFTPPHDEDVPDHAPIIVVTHGLTGGSHESYVRAILAPAVTPKSEGGLGFRGIVVNFRGCAGVPITSPQLYSAGHTEDYRAAILYVRTRYPKAPLLGIGFSLGANVITRYVAEEGDQCRLVSAVALGCPWDLRQNASWLESSWFNREIYSKAMGRNLQSVLRRHGEALAKFEDHPIAAVLEEMLGMSSPYMFEFDNTITKLVGGSAPHFPFKTHRDYYAWARSDNVIQNIRIPFLGLQSSDDPIVPHSPPDCAGNGWVVLGWTRRGGHLGWFEYDSDGQLRRWVRKPVLEWFKAIIDLTDLDEDGNIQGRVTKPFGIVDGFLREEGKEQFGIREIAGCDGEVVGVGCEGGLLAGL
ncbi:AB-hydrolase YheT [Thelephora ganbajun]|uniref:AB-hydrolase YheT n=1 Tax=Thelephora ganbajun TaxID=370292 RepID=A0ACB6ZTD2_THEGA|nr:AB-hydrolase YheT [Thelephora ganbajun]